MTQYPLCPVCRAYLIKIVGYGPKGKIYECTKCWERTTEDELEHGRVEEDEE